MIDMICMIDAVSASLILSIILILQILIHNAAKVKDFTCFAVLLATSKHQRFKYIFLMVSN